MSNENWTATGCGKYIAMLAAAIGEQSTELPPASCNFPTNGSIKVVDFLESMN